MRKYWKIIPVCLLIVLLLIGNLFFLMKANKPTIWIQVAIPLAFDDAGDITTQYLEMVSDKEETDIILLAMVNALPLQKEDFPHGHPDATIIVGYKGVGYPYQVWFTDDSVIWGNKGPDAEFYKEFHNDHTDVIPLLKKIVNSLENNQNYA